MAVRILHFSMFYNLYRLTFFMTIGFGEQPSGQTKENDSDNEGKSQECQECIEKDLMIDNIRERKDKELKQTHDWYEKEMGKIRDKLTKEIEENEKQKALLKENVRTVNEKYHEAVANLKTLEEKYNKKSDCGSVVAQAVCGIVGE